MFEEKVSPRRVRTSEWERVETGDDEHPLRSMDPGSEMTEEDRAAAESSTTVTPSATGETYEPLRKRPTF